MRSNSSHHGLQPRGTYDWQKSTHPDIDVMTGNLKPEAFMDADHREFYDLRTNPTRWQAFMSGVAQRQAREHPDVQSWVGGQAYEGNTLDAFRSYQADIRLARETYGRDTEFTSYDVANMTLEEYNTAFDEHGRPRPGYTYRPTDRDVIADSQAVDRYSRDENLRQSRDWR